jgi:hypothetical protein
MLNEKEIIAILKEVVLASRSLATEVDLYLSDDGDAMTIENARVEVERVTCKALDMINANETFIILWTGVDEFTITEGSLEDAIAEVKRDGGYCNYGRTGAVIVKAQKVYEIKNEAIENQMKV